MKHLCSVILVIYQERFDRRSGIPQIAFGLLYNNINYTASIYDALCRYVTKKLHFNLYRTIKGI